MKNGRITRRNFLNTTFRVSMCAVIGYPIIFEPNWPSTEKVNIPISGLAENLEGFRIGLLADFHRGLYVTEDDIKKAANHMMEERPHIVLLAGDFVEGNARKYIASCLSALSVIRASLGVYAVLGNHDYWTDASYISDSLRDSDIILLKNDIAELTWKGTKFFLIGLDDAWEGNPDLRPSFSQVPSDAMKILLVHEPDYAENVGNPSFWLPLQLSGHSHGGQVRFPIVGAPMLPYLARKYPIGLQKVRGYDRWVYTTRGVGVTIPVRLNCRPEVTILTLTRPRSKT